MILLKKQKKSDYLNLLAYKLITLLNILNKVLEIIIIRHIHHIVKKHDLLLET
jgi:hypothetical protein